MPRSFGRKPKTPDEMIQLKAPPVGGGWSARLDEDCPQISVDCTPWEILSGRRWNEIGRSYEFQGLAGPGSHTKFEIICRLTPAKGGRQGVVPFIYFVVEPYILEQAGFLAAQFAPSDDLIECKIVTVKVEPIAAGANFILLTDEADTDQCLTVLMLGRQITMRLISEKEQLAHFPLENDAGFVQTFSELKRRVLEKDRRPQNNEGQMDNVTDRWNALLRYDEEIRTAAEKLRPLGESWVNELAQAYFALNEDRKYLPNIVSRLIEEAERDKAQRWIKLFRHTAEGEPCTEESLNVLREAESQGYTLSVHSNKSIAVTRKDTGTCYLWSNSDIGRFLRPS